MTQDAVQHCGDTEQYTAILLAGKRPGIDPLADAYDEVYKARVKALGIPMITRVAGALKHSNRVNRIIIVSDPEFGPIESIQGLQDATQDIDIDFVDARSTISKSVLASIQSCPETSRFLITTADHTLLTPEIIDTFLDGASAQAGISVGLVDRKAIEPSYPGMNRTYLKFRGSAVSGANLFATHGYDCMDAIRFWESVEANRKNPLKLFSAFGLTNLLGVALKVFSLERAFERGSEVVGCSAFPVLLPQAEAAIDVDKVADLLTADGILARRVLSQTDFTSTAPISLSAGEQAGIPALG